MESDSKPTPRAAAWRAAATVPDSTIFEITVLLFVLFMPFPPARRHGSLFDRDGSDEQTNPLLARLQFRRSVGGKFLNERHQKIPRTGAHGAQA